MPVRPFTTTLATAGLAASLWAGARQTGPVPPLGPLLDPAHGLWAAAGAGALPNRADAAIPGLSAPVDVRYDSRGVPHIFAATEDDAYRALGYVVARDRLFQLEIQTRAASGRLSEVAGDRTLPLDREQRRLGLARAAERKLAAVDTASAGWHAVLAYADGVNAYIDALPPAALPVEYRLLGTRPERWRPINSIFLLGRMGWTLAYTDPELTRLRARALVGRAAADALFPAHTPIQEPIQPTGADAPRMAFATIPPPGEPDSALLAALGTLPTVGDDNTKDAATLRRQASNNWAVAPSRSATGHALLAGDPHLDLTLPSIWYEAHLVVPGKLDVYGVTIPGSPCVLIGFNRDVAWTFTNTGADVMDFYRETVDDDGHPTHYRLDGTWRPLERRIETYRSPGGAVLSADTMYYTHRGPLVRRAGGGGGGSGGANGSTWLSMRWTVLEPSNEIGAFIAASHARDTREFHAAMAAGYFAPAQNMLAADRRGNIEIRSTGHFPIRPDDGDGRVIRDGSTSASDWRGFWPVDRYPQSRNPAQGFLASANQEPVDPSDAWNSHALLGADELFDPWRALRINQLLRADSAVTPDAMRRYQTDPGSARADLFVPYFLRAATAVARRDDAGSDTFRDELAAAARLLGEWDRRYTRDNQRAVLFEYAFRQLASRTWDELVAPGAGARVATPTSAVLAELLTQPRSAWWDDRRTAGVVEDRDAILAASLVGAYDGVVAKYGRPERGGWRWSDVQHANIYHLLQLPAFSALNVPVLGGPETLSPSSGAGTHGASWRMVVELGPEIRAWGVYPGGQSGNPSSPRYEDHLALWTAGALEPLIVPRSANALPARQTSARLSLAPQ